MMTRLNPAVFLLILLTLLFTAPSKAQEYPLREVRAAWVTSAFNLDWPRTRATSPQMAIRQQQELLDILDKLKDANFNTVLFQTRLRGDVVYDSGIEAYSSVLTGTSDKNPYYDPLAFAVEECHKRGMECHAWMVAIPLGDRRQVQRLGKKSVTKTHPALAVQHRGAYYLNPGHPDTKVYLMSLIKEVVSRYDVDGIHLDYLRYPSPQSRFPDNAQYKKYANGRSLAQWRRDNITEILRYVYKGVKALKPWVKVSTSPIGKYADTPRYSSKGWNALVTVNQDVKGWLAEGIQDQIYPMIYFKGNNFYPFLQDYIESSSGRQVIAGQGTYFLDPKEGDWALEDIHRQILFSRNQGGAGQSQYRVEFVTKNQKGVYDLLKELYRYPALVPPMPWIDDTPPSAPTGLKEERNPDGYVTLSWQAAKDDETRTAPTYAIYGSDTYPVDTSKAENLIATGIRSLSYTHYPMLSFLTKKHYAVTAVDRSGNQSQACQIP